MEEETATAGTSVGMWVCQKRHCNTRQNHSNSFRVSVLQSSITVCVCCLNDKIVKLWIGMQSDCYSIGLKAFMQDTPQIHEGYIQGRCSTVLSISSGSS